MSLELSPEAMAIYRATAQQRWEQEQLQRRQRRSRAWQVAQQAATLLKEKFGATQVMAFGSLVHGHWFSETSDVDLVVSDLEDEDYFIAVAKLQDLSPEFKVDLVMMKYCRPALRESIIKGGKPL